ncbi:MAG: hypothetical protein NXI18_22060 [Alphaproteobacteria bacterium]|nr:hypothetical protein [Alphaproteobacteria bacterium]
MSERLSFFDRLLSGSRIHRTVTVGAFTRIGPWAIIGERVRLGDWSEVGAGSRVGPDCVFGPWAKIGRGVTLGAGVRLGTHSRIGDGTHIPEGMVVGDNELITPQGVFENRTGGFGTSILEEAATVSGPFGHFLIPLDPWDPDELIDQLVDDHQWGRSDALEPCRLLRPPRPEEIEGALKVVRARQEAINRDAEAPHRDDEDLLPSP